MQDPRITYGQTLVRLGETNPNIVVCDADLCNSTMGRLFGAAFPDRHFEMGIAEANMASFAAGLSLTGKIPFINSFAVFASGRAYDQIRQGICIPELNVKIVGSSSGLSDFGDGSTHQAIEDIAIMRAIPNMTVLVPADGIETRKMTEAMVEYAGPVYMRVGRNEMPEVTAEDQPFEIGKPSLLRDGKDVVVYATGGMVSKALDAASACENDGLSVKVVNVSTLKPVDQTMIKVFAEGMKGVVTAEEHTVVGGLSSLICYALRGQGAAIEVVGIQDCFGQSAYCYDDLLELYGLTDRHIAAAIRRAAGQ